jgi:hypothetical protein
MDDADEKPMVSIDPRYLLTGDVVERPADERPKHDTIEAILDLLAGPAQQIPSLSGALDEFAWRMLAAGFPLLRTTLHTRTLHPQYLGASFVWLRTTGQTVQTLVAHEVEELLGHENNPVWKVGLGGETLRRASMSPMTSSISRSSMILRQKARPTILHCRSRPRSAPTTR